MRIIIGVDQSPFSTAAVELVRRMSWPEGSSAVVITAVKPIVMATPEAYVMMAEQVEGLRREQLAQGARYVKTVEADLASSGLKAESRAVDGDPREVLVEACRAEGADLIVLGSHGRTGLAKLLMGSVASHVVTHAPCSVLIVRRPPAP
jgi:nucleotide-binding universal stress UspA family protein